MKQHILTLLLGAAGLTAYAQHTTQPNDTTLTRTVVVEREYTPEILDAQKVNVIPQVVPPVSHHPSVDYDKQLHPANAIPAQVMSPTIIPLAQASGWPGLLRIGFGNLSQWDALAAYRFKPSERDVLSLSAHATGDKSNFNLMNEDTPWSSSHLHGNFDAHYSHRFQRSELTTKGHFGLRKFDLLPSSSIDKQQFTHGGLAFGLHSTQDEAQLLHYDAQAAIAYNSRHSLDQEKTLSETMLNLNGQVWARLKEHHWIDLGIDLHQYLYQGNDALQNQTTLTLRPSYRYETESWKIRLGLKSDLAFGYGKQWQAAPDVVAEYTTGSHVLYAHVDGGRLDNNFQRLSELAPYARLPYVQADATYEQFNASVGWKGSPLPDLWLHLYGGYQQLHNDLLLTRSFLDGTTRFPLVQELQFTKSHNLYGGAALRYSYRELVGLRLSALYRNWSIDEWESEAFKPELELEGALDIQPLKELKLTVGYRHITLSSNNYDAQSDLYVQGNYALSQVWRGLGVFVEAHNLLDKSYELFPSVPALGLRVMGGVSLRF